MSLLACVNSPLPFPTSTGRMKYLPLMNFLVPVKFPIVAFQMASRQNRKQNPNDNTTLEDRGSARLTFEQPDEVT